MSLGVGSGETAKKAILFFSFLVFGLVGFGIYRAMHSDLFLIKAIQIEDQAKFESDFVPVNSEAVMELANIEVGKVNLFSLDLVDIRSRIIKNRWIEDVLLQKQFPQTLSISVKFRVPKAVYQAQTGELFYIDKNAMVFAPVDLRFQSDLPLIYGLEPSDRNRIKSVLRLIESWRESGLKRNTQISTVKWDKLWGYGAVILYGTAKKDHLKRIKVEIGQEIDDTLPIRLSRLDQVIDRLISQEISATKILFSTDKKIVVKTDQGS